MSEYEQVFGDIPFDELEPEMKEAIEKACSFMEEFSITDMAFIWGEDVQVSVSEDEDGDYTVNLSKIEE